MPIGPIPCDEVDSVFALNSSQHSAVEIRQHLVFGIDPFRLVDILISVGNTAVIGHLTKRHPVKLDTQLISVSPVRLKSFSGKGD